MELGAVSDKCKIFNLPKSPFDKGDFFDNFISILRMSRRGLLISELFNLEKLFLSNNLMIICRVLVDNLLRKKRRKLFGFKLKLV